MDKETLFRGYVDAGSAGLLPVEIYKDNDYIYAYVNGELADDVSSASEFEGSYGLSLYESVKQFRTTYDEGPPYAIYDFWPDGHNEEEDE